MHYNFCTIILHCTLTCPVAEGDAQQTRRRYFSSTSYFDVENIWTSTTVNEKHRVAQSVSPFLVS